MSDDRNEKEVPEDEEERSEGEESESSSEATEIDLEPVGSDEGPGDDSAEGGESGPGLLGQGKLSEKDDRTFGMLAHLLGAFTSIVGPLVIWLIKKEESPFVDDQGKEAVNFQITIGLGYLVLMVISIPLGMIPVIGACALMLLWPALGVAGVIFSILGCLKANEGVLYRYPVALRLIK